MVKKTSESQLRDKNLFEESFFLSNILNLNQSWPALIQDKVNRPLNNWAQNIWPLWKYKVFSRFVAYVELWMTSVIKWVTCFWKTKTFLDSQWIGKLLFEIWGPYHLHGKPGNSGCKIKWYASFHLEYSWNYGLLIKVMHFYYSFWDLQLMFIRIACFLSSVKTS